MQLCIAKVLRPDQILSMVRKLGEIVFGWDIAQLDSQGRDLSELVYKQVDAETPLLLCSTPGNDPSSQVEKFAAQEFGGKKGKFVSYAMGSPEAFAEAARSINQ